MESWTRASRSRGRNAPPAGLAAYALALLAACAPDFGEAPPERAYVIVALGDSTTAPRAGVEVVWAQRLEEELERDGIAVRVINAGVSGDTTADARLRFERDVLAKDPDLVLIQLGINDAAVDVYLGQDAPRVSLAEFGANLVWLVERARAAGAQVVLLTPNPLYWTDFTRRLFGGPPYDPVAPLGLNVVLTRYAERVRELARELGVPAIDVWAAFLEDPRSAELVPDGVHPGDAGHALVARTVRLSLRDELRARAGRSSSSR